MNALSISIGVIILIIAGCLISRWIIKYQQKRAVLRFSIWLAREGAGRLSEAPINKSFEALGSFENLENEGVVIHSHIEDWVFSNECYKLIVDSVELAGSCTFSYLKSIFLDYLSFSQPQHTETSCEEKLKTMLAFAQMSNTIFFVETGVENSNQLPMYFSDSAYKQMHKKEKDGRTIHSELSYRDEIRFEKLVFPDVGEASVSGVKDQQVITIYDNGMTYRFKSKGNQIVSSCKGAMEVISYI